MVDLKRQSELRDAIELLYFGYRSFTDRADRILEKRGLGRVHHRILYFIGRRPGLSVGGLLEVLAVTKQALNAPLRQLIQMGLVVQVAGESDRRVRSLRLTGTGEALEAELSGVQMDQLGETFGGAGEGAEAGWRLVMAGLAKQSFG